MFMFFLSSYSFVLLKKNQSFLFISISFDMLFCKKIYTINTMVVPHVLFFFSVPPFSWVLPGPADYRAGPGHDHRSHPALSGLRRQP